MNKTLEVGLGVAGILVVGLFAFNFFTANERASDRPSLELGKYFQEQMFARGTEGGFIPIEGFNAGLLMSAFPGLVAGDFEGVETFEGMYMVENGEAVFTRTKGQPISSAANTISKAGYKTLLQNISLRLSHPIATKGDIDVLINRLFNTSITNFEECVAAGNAIMESYPSQCSDGTQTFTEFIGNELEKIDMIRIDSPRPNRTVESPLVITGEARGYWFFEASFPVSLVDWDGRIIAEGIATAQKDWMTEEFVSFTATLVFTPDPNAYSTRGTLILKKDNPSGLPEHDDALEIPVTIGAGNEAEDAHGAGILPFKSGVRGKVSVGPVCPVETYPPQPGCEDRQLQTTVRVFTKNNDGAPFVSGETGADGIFTFMVPPGEYILEALGREPLLRCESKDIIIVSNTMSEVNLSCDSGIR